MLGVCVTVPGHEKIQVTQLYPPNVGGHHDGIFRKFTKDFIGPQRWFFPFESWWNFLFFFHPDDEQLQVAKHVLRSSKRKGKKESQRHVVVSLSLKHEVKHHLNPKMPEKKPGARWWQLKYFWNFHPEPLGKMNTIWRAYFSFNHHLEEGRFPLDVFFFFFRNRPVTFRVPDGSCVWNPIGFDWIRRMQMSKTPAECWGERFWLRLFFWGLVEVVNPVLV